MSSLLEARESLSYWERRLQTLPRRAVGKRREARAMAERWRTRVDEAERAQYGAGLLGAALMLFAERRLPADTRHTAYQLARVAKHAVIAAAMIVAVLVALVCVAAIQLLF
jgi:hypothetical protein